VAFVNPVGIRNNPAVCGLPENFGQAYYWDDFAFDHLSQYHARPNGGQLVYVAYQQQAGIRRQGPEQVVVDKPAFLNYVRGIIASIVNGMLRKSGFGAERMLKLDDDDHDDDEDGHESEDDAGRSDKYIELADLRDQLFPRLRAIAPKRLLRAINAWESIFTDTDRIPPIGARKYVRQIRDLAQKVLLELGGLR
jgi:hypothetical protein